MREASRSSSTGSLTRAIRLKARVESGGQKGELLLLRVFPYLFDGVAAKTNSKRFVAREGVNGMRESFRVAGRDKRSSVAWTNVDGHAANRRGDHRHTGGEGFPEDLRHALAVGAENGYVGASKRVCHRVGAKIAEVSEGRGVSPCDRGDAVRERSASRHPDDDVWKSVPLDHVEYDADSLRFGQTPCIERTKRCAGAAAVGRVADLIVPHQCRDKPQCPGRRGEILDHLRIENHVERRLAERLLHVAEASAGHRHLAPARDARTADSGPGVSGPPRNGNASESLAETPHQRRSRVIGAIDHDVVGPDEFDEASSRAGERIDGVHGSRGETGVPGKRLEPRPLLRR